MCPLSAEFGYAFSTKTRPLETMRHPRLMKQLQVLVVDNDPDSRHLLTVLFAAYGIRTIATASACKALAILQDIQPDLLISELALPGEDGYCLMQQVKALESRQQVQIPAIALTGYNRKSDQAQALAVGFRRYLVKPVDIDELMITVADLTKSPQMVPTT
ncbi:response regulator [Trichocoleus sp. FACHB-262]|uniref:response regulator n=1 Tax=Trichocoleus sp. FACHB-262 TaxID=2692869 RepID=UPI0018EFB401|nr:response regulator [Trichocoleus sp. FACHB-262]